MIHSSALIEFFGRVFMRRIDLANTTVIEDVQIADQLGTVLRSWISQLRQIYESAVILDLRRHLRVAETAACYYQTQPPSEGAQRPCQ
jgi:hypothetical protein